MTVAELIKQLQDMPQDAKVAVLDLDEERNPIYADANGLTLQSFDLIQRFSWLGMYPELSNGFSYVFIWHNDEK